LNDFDVPDRLNPEAEAVLRGLKFDGNSRGRNPPEHWFTTLADAPRNGEIRSNLRVRVQAL
jgi:acetoin utilization protein AcuC